MYDLIIICNACGAIRSTSLMESVDLSEAQVIEQAGHSPACSVLLRGKGQVRQESRDNPNCVCYVVEEVS